jgi:thiol-disulfide isomerase/thioredoxin
MKLAAAVVLSLVLAASALAVGTHLKGEKPIRIAQGQLVDLNEFLVPGKFTVFDFTSEYLPVCRAYAEPLYLLHQRRRDVAVVRVDIDRSEIHRTDWESPVAQQYGIHGLPHFKVYDRTGKLLADDVSGDRRAFSLVNTWINELH